MIYKYNNLKEMIYDVCNKYSENIALIDINDGKLNKKTYAQILQEIQYLGTGMSFLNPKRTVIIGKNSSTWAISFLTSICSNSITVPLDKELSDEEIITCINRIEADTLIYSDEFNERIKNIKEKITIKNYISMDKTEKNNIQVLQEIGKLEINKGNKDYIDIEIDDYNIAQFLFTSGTTSESKIVMLSHNNIIKNALQAKSSIDINNNDVFLSLLPLHHAFENTCGLIVPLCSGATIAYNDSLKNTLKNFKLINPTVILAVPRIMEIFHKRIKTAIDNKEKSEVINKLVTYCSMTKKFKLIKKKIFNQIHAEFGGKIRVFIVGGAAANVEVSSYLRALGFGVIQGYGTSECSPLITVNEEKKFEDDSIGLIMPDTEIKICNPNDKGIGEIAVKGPQVMLGYYNNEQANKEVFDEDGFYHTGDLGYLGKKNFYYLTGREKNMIVASNGENIYPEEIEYLINKNEIIKESLVYSINNENNKLALVVDIVLEDVIANKIIENPKYEQQVIEIIDTYIKKTNAKLPAYKHITKFNIKTEEFEKTTTLKVKRFKYQTA
ncbi:MAG: AMP-binding protein [Bacilli bacterium]|nr:AMP-binding protein [Bacilli bacterium]